MIDYGLVRSTVKPQEVEMDDYSVYVNSDIQRIEVDDGTDTHFEYEFHQVRYTKDEYINVLLKK